MRNLLALGGAALLVFAGLGWYLGWYKVQSTPTADGQRRIESDLNTNKIKQDVDKGKDKVRKMLSKDKHNTTQVVPQAPGNQPANPQPTGFTPGTPTSFSPGNNTSFSYPGAPPVPTPPSGDPRLPLPR